MRLLNQNKRGIALIGTIILLTTLLISGGVFVSILSHQNQATQDLSDTHRARDLAHQGIQHSTSYLAVHSDWMVISPTLSRTISGGSYHVTLTPQSKTNVSVESTGTYNDSRVTLSRTFDRLDTMSRDTELNSDDATLSDDGKELTDLKIQNNGDSDITLVRVIVSWTPSSDSEKVKKIQIDDNTIWVHDGVGDPDGEQVSGTELTVEPTVIPPSIHYNDLDLTFSRDMSDKMISVVLIFSDGSTLTLEYNPLKSDVASLVTIDTSQAVLSGSDHHILDNIIIANTSGDTAVHIHSLLASWAYDMPVAQLSAIYVGGEIAWEGAASSDATLPLLPFKNTIDAQDSVVVKLVFDHTNSKYRLFDFSFVFDDGSKKAAVVDFTFPQADYLSVISDDAVVDGYTVSPVQLSNTHSDGAIWIDGVTITGDDMSQLVKKVSIGDAVVWGDGNGVLGELIPISVTEITSSTVPFAVEFDSIPTSAYLSLSFRMVDGTSKAVMVDLPQDFPQGDRVVINSVDARVHMNRKNLFGLTINNESDDPVRITKIKTSWSRSRWVKLQKFMISNTNLLAGGTKLPSGVEYVLSTPYEISGNSGVVPIELRFYGWSIVNRDFDIELTFEDESQRTIDLNLNPHNRANYLGGANFEYYILIDILQDIFNGFNGPWDSTCSDSHLIKSGTANTYSGSYHLALGKNSYVQRPLRPSVSEAPFTIEFRAKLKSAPWTSGSRATFQVFNGTAWETKVVWDSDNSPTSYQKYVVPVVPTDTDVKIRFETNSGAHDVLYLDEIYLYR